MLRSAHAFALANGVQVHFEGSAGQAQARRGDATQTEEMKGIAALQKGVMLEVMWSSNEIAYAVIELGFGLRFECPEVLIGGLQFD